jgi:hypothetical protein
MIVVLAFSLLIGGIVTYVSSRAPSEMTLQVRIETPLFPFFPETGLMILCPSKARQIGLCNMDERQLYAKYMVTVSPPPNTSNPAVTCKVMLEPEPYPRQPNPAGTWVNFTMIDKSSEFTCTHSRIGQDEFELDLTFIGNPDDEQLIRDYVLAVTIDYNEPLLPWIPLVTRTTASGMNVADLCLLGYHIGKHPPPGMGESQNPLGEFRGCTAAMFWERQMLGLERPCEINACPWVGAEEGMLSHVTVHVVDEYGKPIQNVTVWLNTTFCCYFNGRDLGWTIWNSSETSDSDGNARFALVIPYARYAVIIGGVVLSEITAPPPAASTTITVILTQTPTPLSESLIFLLRPTTLYPVSVPATFHP